MSLPVDEIVCGDAFEVLKTFPEESIDLVMFSPPYWGLRDYKIPKVDDVFAVGGLGLESHPSQYIKRMVVLGSLLKRVLKKSGSMWINMGDTYFGGKGKSGSATPNETDLRINTLQRGYQELEIDRPQNIAKQNGYWLQPKQKLLIPERVAIALQEDGWILRNDIIWHKPNHMPASVKDRLTSSWEHLYFFVKSRRYFFDLDAIRQPHKEVTFQRAKYGRKTESSALTTDFKETSAAFKKGGLFDWQKEHGMEPNPLGKAPDDTISYEGKFDGFGFESEKFGSPRARNERKEKHGMNSPHRMRDDPQQYLAIDPSRPSDLSHPLGKNPSDTIEASPTFKRPSWASTPGHSFTHERQFEKGTNEDFWSLTTQPFKGAHFAVYPEKLCENPIKAACPQWICSVCGKPKTRITNAESRMKIKNLMFSIEEFGVYLKRKREEKGLTSNEVASYFPSISGGITGCVWNWENGLNIPTMKQYKKLKQILDLNSHFDFLLDSSLRESEMEYIPRRNPELAHKEPKAYPSDKLCAPRPQGMKYGEAVAIRRTVGWSSCNCNAPFTNGIVLDPMCGSGTTLIVARKFCRHYIGIELNPSYVEMAKKRLATIPKRLDLEVEN